MREEVRETKKKDEEKNIFRIKLCKRETRHMSGTQLHPFTS